MKSLVSTKCHAVLESFVALCTLEGFLTDVSYLVPTKVRGTVKSFASFFAVVGFLTGVNPPVLGKV